MKPQPPIKCTSTRVTISDIRYRLWSDGSISGSLTQDQCREYNITTKDQLNNYEERTPLYSPYSPEAKSIRKEASRLRRGA